MPFLGGQISPSGQLRTPAATLIFVRFRGQSGSRFRAAEGLFIAISGSSVSCDHVFAFTQTMSFELVQQDLGVNQVRRVETLGEPVVDGEKEVVGVLPLALALPQAGK